MASASYLRAMGDLLVFHRVVNKASEVTDANLDEVVTEFQESKGLLADGLPGDETIWHLQRPWVEQEPKLMLVKCPADKLPGIDGFDHLVLREDAAERFNAIASDVRNQGGAITTAGGLRPLTSGANAHRSSKSMHYPAIAFDLSLPSGFFKPKKDPFVITRGKNTHWNVWCRAEGGEQTGLKATYWDSWGSGKDRHTEVKGKFLNFTKICRKHGFHPIGPRKAFLRANDRKYLSSEWWHFQANDLLIPGLSQLGIELLKIVGYSQESIESQNRGVWQNRKARYQKNWS